MTKSFKTEKDVKREVKSLLTKHRWWFWMPPSNGFGIAGIADLHAIRDGVFLAIETKVYPNKPTALQKAFLSSISASGGFGFVVSDKSMGWFAVWLQSFDKMVASQQKGEKPGDVDGAANLDAMKIMTADYANIV